MAAAKRPYRIAACLVGATAWWLLRPVPAAAFPNDDPLNPAIVPTGADLAAPDVQQLDHQMGLLSGFGTAASGWTITPSVTVEETFTDNVLQAHDPRRWDLITVVRPNIGIVGDTPRAQLRLAYEPGLQLYARTGSQNSLTHQLNTTGLITLVPHLLYVDVRGLAGVQSLSGGIGGLGTVGASSLSTLAAGSLAQGSQIGATKQNLFQSASFAISPYLLREFDDGASARIGLSLNRSSTSRITGFTALPWETGTDSQQQTGIEATASYQTGNRFSRVRDSVSVDLQQSFGTGQLGLGNSDHETFNNRVDYAWDQSLSFYAQLGWERLNYSGATVFNRNGPTGQIGATLTPNADTSVTLGWGREDGTTSFSFDGHYAVTPRTTLTGSYHSGITTQTGSLRSQLYAAAVANNGSLIDSNTGQPLLQAYNALGITPGVFRFSTLTLGARSVLERDTITATITYSTRTSVGSGVTSPTTQTKTAGITWTHLLSPRLTMNADLYLSTGEPSGGIEATSVAAGLGGQYTLSETVSTFARYALFERQSKDTALSMYQNLLLVGIRKQF